MAKKSISEYVRKQWGLWDSGDVKKKKFTHYSLWKKTKINLPLFHFPQVSTEDWHLLWTQPCKSALFKLKMVAECILSSPAVKPETVYSIWTTYGFSDSHGFYSFNNDSQGPTQTSLFVFLLWCLCSREPTKAFYRVLVKSQKQRLDVLTNGSPTSQPLHQGYLP